MASTLKKPIARVARGVEVPRGVVPDIVVTLYPGGVIGLRELRRRAELTVSVGKLYSRLAWEAARARRGRK